MPDAPGIIGIALGVPGLIEVCIKLGTSISEIIETYQNTDDLAKEFRVKFSALWKNLNDILGNLDRIKDKLGFGLEDEVHQMLKILRDTLIEAIEKAAKAAVFSTF